MGRPGAPPKPMRNSAAEISRTLRSVLETEKGLTAFARGTRWGDGPIYFVGSRASYPACLTGAAAFEAYLGIPAVARVEAEFLAYTVDIVRPHALVFVIPPFDEGDAMLAALRPLKAKGARLLTLGGQPNPPFASLAEATLPVTSLPEPLSPFFSRLARHATLAYLALVAARVLKQPSEVRRREEVEFESLPEQAGRALLQSSDAIQFLADEVRKASRLHLIGGGRFFPVSLEIAPLLAKTTGVEVLVQDVSHARPPEPQAEARAIVLSCSRCRVSSEVERWAAGAAKSGVPVLALTDAADKNLLAKSRLALLLPALGEAAAAILQLAVAGAWAEARERVHGRPE